MNISIAEEKDLTQILALQKACYFEEAALYDDFSIPPLTQTLNTIKEDFQKETFLKVEYEGNIIGSVRGNIDGQTCKIGRLIVAKAFRNQGIGKKLMHAIEAHFSTANRFELFTGHKSERNLALYQKLGYTECRQQHVNTKLTLIFLEKHNTE